jgi:hypothetical protein
MSGQINKQEYDTKRAICAKELHRVLSGILALVALMAAVAALVIPVLADRASMVRAETPGAFQNAE